MNKLQTIGMNLSKLAGRKGLILKKFSPEILIGVGVVGLIGTAVMVHKAAIKADMIMEETHEKIEKIKQVKETHDETVYSQRDYHKDMAVVMVDFGISMAKTYGPAVTLGVASIGCILGAHGIMQKRNVALVAAYKAVEQGFASYRDRVIEELGEDKDRQFKYGIRQEQVTYYEEDENGKKRKVKKTIESVDTNDISTYARFFDECSPHWVKNAEYNLMFLKCQQNYANDMLKIRGHVFLNEVYDMIGVPRSSAGAVVGWVKGEGDDFIDFGIYNYDSERGRLFVNGEERSILLDFNVDGVIYDMI